MTCGKSSIRRCTDSSPACRCPSWWRGSAPNPFRSTAARERANTTPFRPRTMTATRKKPIYLDYSATTPVDPRVAQKMIPWLTEHFGNPASRSHGYGWEAEEAVENARVEVAKLVNADAKEIGWTSGATASDNPR